MRKERTLFFVGIWVGVLPFLGIPSSWRKVLFIITGVAIIYLAYLFRKEFQTRISIIKSNTDEQSMDSFVDNVNDL